MLRLLELHRIFYQFISTVTHISGDTNSMEDDASRLWNLSDNELLAHFNSKYPQARYWKLAALSPRMHSALISSFYKRRSTKGWFLSRSRADKRCFRKWEIFCRYHNIDTFLDKVRDLVPFLQIFTRRVRSGLLAHNGETVRSRTAEAYLWAVSGLNGKRGDESTE